jgi:hypothetical protein
VSNTHLPELQTVYSQQNKVNGLIIEWSEVVRFSAKN